MNTLTIPDVPRTIRHGDTDEQWRARSIDSKMHSTAVEAAHRLRGLSDILYSVGLGAGHQLRQFLFLGAAAADIALALERASKAQWAAWEAEDRKPARKPAAKPRKATGRRARA